MTGSSVETKTHSWGGHPRSRVGALAVLKKTKKRRKKKKRKKKKKKNSDQLCATFSATGSSKL